MSSAAYCGGMTEGVFPILSAHSKGEHLFSWLSELPQKSRRRVFRGVEKRRRGSCRGGAFTKNGEVGRGVALPKTRLGDGRPLPQIPMQAAVRRGVIFHSIIPKHGRKINLLLLFCALLPHPGAVECVFHALLTVERLTFPVFLRIIEAWKKIRTALPRSSAKTS